MSFLKGFAVGAGTSILDNQQRMREKLERQRQEARQLSKVAEQRRQQADTVLQDIRNTSQSYGIDEQVLYSAYRNGDYEQYKGMIESVRQAEALRGTTTTPETLQSLYEVPSSVIENPADLSTEIKRIFGVIEQGLGEVEPDDVGIGRLLLRGLGIDEKGALARETVDGYSIEKLMDMPLPTMPQGDGGRISQDAYRIAARPTRSPGSLTNEQVARTVGPAIIGEIRSTLREAAFDSQFENLEPSIQAAVTAYVEQMEDPTVDSVMAAREEIIRQFVRPGQNGTYWVDTGSRDPDGNRMFHQINRDGVPIEGTRTAEDRIPRPSEIEVTPVIPSPSGTQVPQAGSPGELPPEGVHPVINHREHGTMVFTRMTPEGNAQYRTEDGRFFEFPPLATQPSQ